MSQRAQSITCFDSAEGATERWFSHVARQPLLPNQVLDRVRKVSQRCLTSRPNPRSDLWFLVIDPSLRKLSFVFVKVTDFDQGRPDLLCGMNLTHHVVDDPRHVLLEKV